MKKAAQNLHSFFIGKVFQSKSLYGPLMRTQSPAGDIYIKLSYRVVVLGRLGFLGL